MAEQINYIPAGPVVAAFHQSDAFVRALKGPVGSSKSSACCVEIFDRAVRQPPGRDRKRRSRWAVLRNTYPELKSTTIKTWLEWFPMTVMKWDAPISGHIDIWLPDKTRLVVEVYFLALERPEDIGKLKSLELTGAWLNEAGEMAKQVFDMVTQRVGRFPPVKDGGPLWSGVLLDSNPPDTDSWWFRLFEEQKPKGFECFHQPGGLKEVAGQYLPNPEAENVANLPGGYEYYLRQLAGKSKEWIKVYLEGQYGIVVDGKAIYPEYNDDLHCREIEPIKPRPLLLGFDYGLTPACVIGQIEPRGTLLIHDELTAEDMGIRQFAHDVLKPHLATNWAGYGFQAWGDPAGTARAQSDEKTCFMELAEAGIPASPASSNVFLTRREAVARYLTKLIDGKPGFLLHPRCSRLRKGFMGGYCYRRLATGGERYRDVPDKNIYSHCFPGFVEISTPIGRRRIDAISPGDIVCTPSGECKVTATMSSMAVELLRLVMEDGAWLICTSEHRLPAKGRGFIRADALQYGDYLILEGEAWEDPRNTRSKNSTAFVIIASLVVTTRQIICRAGDTCTEWFGRNVAVAFQRVFASITSMVNAQITESRIWNLCRIRSMPLIMAENASSVSHNSLSHRSTRFDHWPQFGTALKKAWHGIENTASELRKMHLLSDTSVSDAAKTMKLSGAVENAVSALWLASLALVERAGLTMKRVFALFVAHLSRLISTPELLPAGRVVRVELLRRKEPLRVYDLTVEGAHVFYANGFLVSNCHDGLQYLALGTQLVDTASFVKKIEYKERVI
jgi:hypothetical protein